MRGMLLVAGAGLLALTGCGSGNNADRGAAATNQTPPEPINGAAPGDNIAAKVVDMSDAERRGVLARAIIDAGLKCDGVIKGERMADQGGLPQWRATCKNGTQHLVTITPNGTAQLMSRADNH